MSDVPEVTEPTKSRAVYPPVGPEMLLNIWLAYENGAKDAEVQESFGVSHNTAAHVRYARERKPELIERLRSGDIVSLNGLMEEAGYSMSNRRGPRDRDKAIKAVRLSKDGREITNIVFGKGDPWREASEPLRRYLLGWRTRDYLFRHLNPKEAGKRVTLIDELIEGLQKARADLEARAHRSAYSAPHNRKKRR